MRAILARRPVATLAINLATTPLNTATWTQLLAVLAYACDEAEFFNQSTSPILLAEGAAGYEVAKAYTLLPGTRSMVPFVFRSKSRMSAMSVGAAANTGFLIINLFG